jgi:hypothetical protein
MVVKGVCGKCQTVAAPRILLEDEELFHPVPAVLSHDRRRDERKTRIASSDESNVCKEALCKYVLLELVAVLASGIEILIPDVGQLVLVEIQHSADGREVVRGSKTALKRQLASPSRLNAGDHRGRSGPDRSVVGFRAAD